MNRLAVNLYVLLTAVELFARAGNRGDWEMIAKPLLMPALALAFLLGFLKLPDSRKKQGRKLAIWTIVALFFCWIGDVSLMWAGGVGTSWSPLTLDSEQLFLLGLSAFLLGHLCWVGSFSWGPFIQKPAEKRSPLIPILVVLYAGSLLAWLWGGLAEMVVPVCIYASVIAFMTLMAWRRKNKVPVLSYQLSLVGAMTFVASDSLIAIDRFGTAFPQVGVVIMLTYCIAQLLIVSGLVEQLRQG